MGSGHAQQQLAGIPAADPKELGDYDVIIFDLPTRFGNMTGQMRTFLDQTDGLCIQGSLVGKVGRVFTSSSTQHGGLHLPEPDAHGRNNGRQVLTAQRL